MPFPALLYRREKPEWYRVAISNVLSDKDNISKGYASEHEYYMCGNNKRTKACTPHMTSAEKLEMKVLAWMKENIPDPDLKMDVKLMREKCIEYLDKVYVDEDGVVEIIPNTR